MEMPRRARDSSVMDTPTKAERCARPKTRGWQALVNASRNDEEKAKRLRSELARYIAGADRLSARRAARRRPPRNPAPTTPDRMASASSAEAMVTPRRAPALRTSEQRATGPKKAAEAAEAAEPPRKKKKKVPEGTGQPEHAPDPTIPDWSGRTPAELLECIKTLATPWTDRVAALRALQKVDGLLPDAGADGLCVQLADLRSKIVVEAADTVVARAGRLSAAHAVKLFRAAASGIAVKKAVMGDARERAMLGALSAQAGAESAWAAACEVATSMAQERGRKVAVIAVAAWARSGALETRQVDGVVETLGKAAVDRSVPVRDAARALHAAVKEGQTKEVAEAIFKKLPANAQSRLAAGAKGAKAGRQGGGAGMREMIKQKKLAKLKAEAARKKAEMGAAGGEGAVLVEVVNSTKKESPAPRKTADGQ